MSSIESPIKPGDRLNLALFGSATVIAIGEVSRWRNEQLVHIETECGERFYLSQRYASRRVQTP